MMSCASSDGRKNSQHFSTHLFCADLCHQTACRGARAVPAKHEEILGCDVQSKTAPSQEVAEVLEANMEERKTGNFISIFAITALTHLQEAATKQVRQIPRASTAVCTHAASAVRV